MDRIRHKQSEIRIYQERIVEIKELVKGIDLHIAELQVSKSEEIANIQIKKSQLGNVPEGEQFQRNRKQIKVQIENILKSSNRTAKVIKDKLAYKEDLNGEIDSLESQMADIKDDLIRLKKGADLTNVLRAQMDSYLNNALSFLDSRVDSREQFKQQVWYKKQLEMIGKYESDGVVVDNKLGQKQSEQNQQMHLFLFQMRLKYNNLSTRLENYKRDINNSYDVFNKQKRQKQQKIGRYNKVVDQLTKSKYHKAQLYHQPLQRYQENLALSSSIEGEKTQKQLQNLKKQQLALQVLKQKQTYLSELKILIELQQLDPSTLLSNNFDLPKYKSLLAKKMQSFKAIAQNPTQQALLNPEFLQLNKQISAITNALNTTNLLIPYKYPIQLLLTTKQQMLQDHFNRLIKQTDEKIKQQHLRTSKMQQQKKQLQGELTLLTKELDQAEQNYTSFKTQWENRLKDNIKQPSNAAEAIPQEMNQPPKPAGKITNLQEIIQKSRLFIDTTTNQQLVEKYEKTRALTAQYWMQALTTQQQYLNPLFLTSSLTKSKLPPKKNDKKTLQLQAEQTRLLITAKKIFQYKQKQGDLSSLRKSNIGLYSSIY